MKQNGYRNAEMIQPIRGKDKNKSDRKTTRGNQATPEFDRTGNKTPQGVSPIKKDLVQNKSVHQLGDDKGRHLPSPYRGVSDRNYKSGITESKLSEREHHPSISKKVAHQSPLISPEEKIDSSFELEEKRIKRENLFKNLLFIATRVIESFQFSEKNEMIETLRRQSRIYEVQMEYAVQQRNSNLKTEFFHGLRFAAKRHNYHMRLVRNFARVLNRPIKGQIQNTLTQSFYQIKNLKTALFKPHARKTTKPVITHARSNTNSTISEVTKSIPMDTFGAGDIQIPSQVKKLDNGKSPITKPKIKIEENRNERNKTPVKDSISKRQETSKEAMKTREVPKKQELKPEIQPAKSKELPSKKSSGIVPIKPYSVNSSRDDLNLSSSKVRQSVASELKQTSIHKNIEDSVRKPESNMKMVPIVDTSNSIMDKHMELKRKLLKQIRGEDGTDTEDLEDSTPKGLVGMPYTEESNKNQSSILR